MVRENWPKGNLFSGILRTIMKRWWGNVGAAKFHGAGLVETTS